MTFKLSQSKSFQIIDRAQVRKLLQEHSPDIAGSSAELAQLIGKDMNANYVLFGSFTIFEDEIQIITMLTNVQTGQISPIVSEYYDKADKKTMIENLSNTVFDKLEKLIIREDS